MSEQSLLLLIDIGNTNTKIGLAQGESIIHYFVLPTNLQETADTFGFKVVELCQYLLISPQDIQAWVISSVVPSLDHVIRKAGEIYSKCTVYFVPTDISLPLKNRYAHPEEVGADRLVTAYAARNIFSSSGLIVIDFGTATTMDCILDLDYLGGLICPGILSSLEALGGKTAKLPRISLDLSSFSLEIGISTATSMSHGFIFGFASMVEGLCLRLKMYLRGEVTVVATGGFAKNIQPVCPCIQKVRDDLLLQGLIMAYKLIVKDG